MRKVVHFAKSFRHVNSGSIASVMFDRCSYTVNSVFAA